MNLRHEFTKGFLVENPAFRLLLGMCPLLAVTTAAINGLGMGLATTAVLLASNLLISSMRHLVPPKIRIPIFIVVIATFVTLVDMFMAAFVPGLHDVLGLFVPLIVVNCLILQRAESFASKKGPLAAGIDGLGMGLGFTFALVILAAIREIIGSGSLFGVSLFGANFQPMLIMILPPGAFLSLGLVVGLLNYLRMRRAA